MNGSSIQFLNSGSSGSAGHSILSTYDFNFTQAFSSSNLGTNRRIFTIKEYSSQGQHGNPLEMYAPVKFRTAYNGTITAQIDHLTGIGTFKKLVVDGEAITGSSAKFSKNGKWSDHSDITEYINHYDKFIFSFKQFVINL